MYHSRLFWCNLLKDRHTHLPLSVLWLSPVPARPALGRSVMLLSQTQFPQSYLAQKDCKTAKTEEKTVKKEEKLNCIGCFFLFSFVSLAVFLPQVRVQRLKAKTAKT